MLAEPYILAFSKHPNVSLGAPFLDSPNFPFHNIILSFYNKNILTFKSFPSILLLKEKEGDNIMTQKRLSLWLGLVVFILFITGILFFAGISYLLLFKEGTYFFKGNSDLIFLWAVAFCCYGILFQFWKITRQIGCENSFSMENSHSFMIMTRFAAAIFMCFLLRLLYGVFIEDFFLFKLCSSLLMLVISLVFSILSFALSKLVDHAYQVKKETEYTI